MLSRRYAKNTYGFSLIEILVVVAIVAVLASVALSTYQSSVIKSNRGDAQAVLSSFAQEMERHFVSNQTYLTTVDEAVPSAPTIFSNQSPISGDAKYTLVVQELTATSYTLRATPSADVQAGDGYLELLSTGGKRWDRNNNNSIDADENCWAYSC